MSKESQQFVCTTAVRNEVPFFSTRIYLSYPDIQAGWPGRHQQSYWFIFFRLSFDSEKEKMKKSVLHPGIYIAIKPMKSATQNQQLMLNSCRRDKLLLSWHRCYYTFTGQYFLLLKNTKTANKCFSMSSLLSIFLETWIFPKDQFPHQIIVQKKNSEKKSSAFNSLIVIS